MPQSQLRRVGLVSLALAVLGASILFDMSPRSPYIAHAAACNLSGITITRVSSPVHYIDTGVTPNLIGMYAGYSITNGSGTDYDDL